MNEIFDYLGIIGLSPTQQIAIILGVFALIVIILAIIFAIISGKENKKEVVMPTIIEPQVISKKDDKKEKTGK